MLLTLLMHHLPFFLNIFEHPLVLNFNCNFDLFNLLGKTHFRDRQLLSLFVFKRFIDFSKFDVKWPRYSHPNTYCQVYFPAFISLQTPLYIFFWVSMCVCVHACVCVRVCVMHSLVVYMLFGMSMGFCKLGS